MANVTFHVQSYSPWDTEWETLMIWDDHKAAEEDLSDWQESDPYSQFRVIKVTGKEVSSTNERVDTSI